MKIDDVRASLDDLVAELVRDACSDRSFLAARKTTIDVSPIRQMARLMDTKRLTTGTRTNVPCSCFSRLKPRMRRTISTPLSSSPCIAPQISRVGPAIRPCRTSMGVFNGVSVYGLAVGRSNCLRWPGGTSNPAILNGAAGPLFDTRRGHLICSPKPAKTFLIARRPTVWLRLSMRARVWPVAAVYATLWEPSFAWNPACRSTASGLLPPTFCPDVDSEWLWCRGKA